MSAPRLETARVILRPWIDSDVAAWAAMNADERVMQFFPSTIDRSESERSAARLRDELERKGFGWWVLQVKGDPRFAGVIALQDVPATLPFAPAFEVGWRLMPDFWGHGYATAGARAALEYAFADLKRDEVVALTAALNVRSQRVMQRIGMIRDPRADFNHPRLDSSHPLGPHVLYRIGSNRGEPSATANVGARIITQ